MAEKQIGVLACSGEECLGGTISRLATRRLMEELRPENTVTLCLPLYIAGGEEERAFARDYPVIAVDGCEKCCAKRATLKYSGAVRESLTVSALLGEETALSKTVSGKALTSGHYAMVEQVAQAICEKFDGILDDG